MDLISPNSTRRISERRRTTQIKPTFLEIEDVQDAVFKQRDQTSISHLSTASVKHSSGRFITQIGLKLRRWSARAYQSPKIWHTCSLDSGQDLIQN